MRVENILNNNEYKLFFLRAILLGIDYGSSNNPNYYKKNIQNEIFKLLNFKSNNTDSEKIEIKNNNIKNINNISLTKYENNILNLENQKKYVNNYIIKLSSNNYGFHYSKINILKNNLLIINQEIEKNKLLYKKYKETNKQNRVNNSDYINNQKNTNKENLVVELEKTLGNLSSLFIN